MFPIQRGPYPKHEEIGMDVIGSTFFFILFLIALFACLGSFFTVKTAEVAVIMGFGRFLRIADPGLNWKRRSSTPWPAASACGSIRTT